MEATGTYHLTRCLLPQAKTLSVLFTQVLPYCDISLHFRQATQNQLMEGTLFQAPIR